MTVNVQTANSLVLKKALVSGVWDVPSDGADGVSGPLPGTGALLLATVSLLRLATTVSLLPIALLLTTVSLLWLPVPALSLLHGGLTGRRLPELTRWSAFHGCPFRWLGGIRSPGARKNPPDLDIADAAEAAPLPRQALPPKRTIVTETITFRRNLIPTS